jgi:hypothetical protein
VAAIAVGQEVKPQAKIGRNFGWAAAKNVSLIDQRCESASHCADASLNTGNDDGPEPRVQRQLRETTATIGNGLIGINRSKHVQDLASFLPRLCWYCIHHGEGGWVGDAPRRQLKPERG